MFAPLSAHSPIGIQRLVAKLCTTPSTAFYHDIATLRKQALAEIHAGNPPAHPRQLKKTIGDRLAKRIFVTKNALCRYLRSAKSTFQSRFGRNWVTFWTLLAVVWLQKVSKTARQTPQINQKWCLGAFLDRLEAISIPSVSISKGIKNKNFDRFWVPRGVPP